jgi:hypothetical protein
VLSRPVGDNVSSVVDGVVEAVLPVLPVEPDVE